MPNMSFKVFEKFTLSEVFESWNQYNLPYKKLTMKSETEYEKEKSQ